MGRECRSGQGRRAGGGGGGHFGWGRCLCESCQPSKKQAELKRLSPPQPHTKGGGALLCCLTDLLQLKQPRRPERHTGLSLVPTQGPLTSSLHHVSWSSSADTSLLIRTCASTENSSKQFVNFTQLKISQQVVQTQCMLGDMLMSRERW